MMNPKEIAERSAITVGTLKAHHRQVICWNNNTQSEK